MVFSTAGEAAHSNGAFVVFGRRPRPGSRAPVTGRVGRGSRGRRPVVTVATPQGPSPTSRRRRRPSSLRVTSAGDETLLVFSESERRASSRKRRRKRIAKRGREPPQASLSTRPPPTRGERGGAGGRAAGGEPDFLDAGVVGRGSRAVQNVFKRLPGVSPRGSPSPPPDLPGATLLHRLRRTVASGMGKIFKSCVSLVTGRDEKSFAT